MKLEGRHILITGANRGIGLALAEKAASHKMHLHLLVRTENRDSHEDLKNKGAVSVRNWYVDMSDRQSIDDFIQKFSQQGGEPHVLINNAGLLTGGLIEEQPLDQIYQMLQVNLAGMIHLTQGLLPLMHKLDCAKVVNNASVSGLMYLPCASTYATSKAGVVAFTESLRNELEGTPVSTMVMITPGVKTRMYDKIFDLYSGHLDLGFLSSIPAEEWAERVFDHIKKDKAQCWPKGTSYFGVKMGQHTPRLLARFVRPYFKREV